MSTATASPKPADFCSVNYKSHDAWKERTKCGMAMLFVQHCRPTEQRCLWTVRKNW